MSASEPHLDPCRVYRLNARGLYQYAYKSQGKATMPRYVAEAIARNASEKHRGSTIVVEPVLRKP